MTTLEYVIPVAIGIVTVIALRIQQKKKILEIQRLLLEDQSHQLAQMISVDDLPKTLHELIAYSRKYSVGDDNLREKLMTTLHVKQKREIIAKVDILLPDINRFLVSVDQNPPCGEAIVLTNLVKFSTELAQKVRR